MESEQLLAKSEQFIRSARILANHKDFDSAISRLYYAMFFVAEALLDKLGLSFSSHHAIIAAFGQHFAKTQQVDPRFHRILITPFDMRQRGDYSVDSGFTRTDVDNLLVEATNFLAVARQWLAEQAENSKQ
jgi:uncharacterized protein (UPF0332 family)